MGSIHTTTYQCDFCKKKSGSTDVVNNDLVINLRHLRRRAWEICDQCADEASLAIDELRARLWAK
jgi:hypothetical protein